MSCSGDHDLLLAFSQVALLATLPGSVVTAAMDEPSLVAALDFMANYDSGLSAVRYPRDNVSDRFADEECPPFALGKARPLLTHAKPDLAVLGYGVPAITAMEAVDLLANEYSVNVYDARFAKPVDEALLKDLLDRGIQVITIEDHSIKGGFGTQVLEACNRLGLDSRLVQVLGLPDNWIYQGSRGEQLAETGLDAASIARAIRGFIAEDLPASVIETSPLAERRETNSQ